VNTGFVKTG